MFKNQEKDSPDPTKTKSNAMFRIDSKHGIVFFNRMVSCKEKSVYCNPVAIRKVAAKATIA